MGECAMPKPVQTYHVFLASPTGLEVERQAFKLTLDAYTTSDAERRGVRFKAEMCEDALRGVGRPQEFINRQIKSADYFFLLLSDRWGSPPDAEGWYSSAVEEEFTLAMQCYASPEFPMRQVVVCFKPVSPERLADMDDQLKQVLEFKAKLEREKTHYPHTFETVGDLQEIVRRHLGQWLWDHEKGIGKSALPVPQPATCAPSGLPPTSLVSPGRLLEKALALAPTERHTEAEVLFACALAEWEHPEVLFPYGLLLLRLGRLGLAEELFRRTLLVSENLPAPEWAGRAHIGLGHVLLQRGEFAQAEQEYRTALQKETAARRTQGIANAHANIANVLMRLGRLQQAEQVFSAALDVHREMGDQLRAGVALASMASIRAMRGRYADAEALYETAINAFEAEGHADYVATTYSNLGNIYTSQQEWDKAEHAFAKAVEIAQRVGNLETLATAYGNLGTVASGRDDLDAAERIYLKAFEIEEQLGRPEGLANLYAYQGNVLSRRNQFEDAIALHHQALELEERLGRLAGMANAFCNMGNVLFRKEDFSRAAEMHRKAITIEESLDRPEDLAKSHMYLGDALAGRGDCEQAEVHYRHALHLFNRLQLELRIREVGKRLSDLHERDGRGPRS
jgi:tetratricopeptide (TPR) repeat protein